MEACSHCHLSFHFFRKLPENLVLFARLQTFNLLHFVSKLCPRNINTSLACVFYCYRSCPLLLILLLIILQKTYTFLYFLFCYFCKYLVFVHLMRWKFFNESNDMVKESSVIFFRSRVRILAIDYKCGQYCTPLNQSDCEYFLFLAVVFRTCRSSGHRPV